ncbi:MAG: hypothetical protein KF722_15990 [Nitrospira sp.]|nr:hypothetical protein [Nitrospira sp.]
MIQQSCWRSGLILLSCMLFGGACASKQGNTVSPVRSDMILKIDARNGPTPSHRDSVIQAKQSGVKTIVVKLENVSGVDDHELLELVELEVKELLKKYGFTQEQYSLVKCPQACAP